MLNHLGSSEQFIKLVTTPFFLQCDTMVEQHEEAIENWFFKTDQEKPLLEYLCRERVLPKEESGERKYVMKKGGVIVKWFKNC